MPCFQCPFVIFILSPLLQLYGFKGVKEEEKGDVEWTERMVEAVKAIATAVDDCACALYGEEELLTALDSVGAIPEEPAADEAVNEIGDATERAAASLADKLHDLRQLADEKAEEPSSTAIEEEVRRMAENMTIR